MVYDNQFNEKLACQVVADITGNDVSDIMGYATVKETFYEMYEWLYLDEINKIEQYEEIVNILLKTHIPDTLGYESLAEYEISQHEHIFITNYGIVYYDKH